MTTKQAILNEASRIRLEDFVSTELGGLIDYRTGEILDERTYASLPYRAQPDPLLPSFANVRSVNQLGRFLAHLDQRTLVTVNDTRKLYDMDKGAHHLHGRQASFTNLQYARLNQLVSRLDYANSLITTPTALARHLRIHRNHVYRYLAPLGSLVRLQGHRDGMAKGSLRVDLCPAYAYRYPRAELRSSRQDAIEAWYRAILQ